MNNPAVAIRIIERQERAIVLALGVRPGLLLARLEVEDLASSHPALGEFGMRGFDIGDDEMQPAHRTGGGATVSSGRVITMPTKLETVRVVLYA